MEAKRIMLKFNMELYNHVSIYTIFLESKKDRQLYILTLKLLLVQHLLAKYKPMG